MTMFGIAIKKTSMAESTNLPSIVSVTLELGI